LVTTTLHDTPDLGKLEKISRAHGAVLSFFIQEQISR
jgi:hypothetical protein